MKIDIKTVIILLLIVVAGLSWFSRKGLPIVSGVNIGNDYIATTTRNFDGTAMTNLTVVSSTNGSIGEVTITGAAAGTINLFDATTSDITKRRSTMSTSSILITTIPNSAAAGTYQINSRFNNGLLVELLGTVPTSTINYR